MYDTLMLSLVPTGSFGMTANKQALYLSDN